MKNKNPRKKIKKKMKNQFQLKNKNMNQIVKMNKRVKIINDH